MDYESLFYGQSDNAAATPDDAEDRAPSQVSPSSADEPVSEESLYENLNQDQQEPEGDSSDSNQGEQQEVDYKQQAEQNAAAAQWYAQQLQDRDNRMGAVRTQLEELMVQDELNKRQRAIEQQWAADVEHAQSMPRDEATQFLKNRYMTMQQAAEQAANARYQIEQQRQQQAYAAAMAPQYIEKLANDNGLDETSRQRFYQQAGGNPYAADSIIGLIKAQQDERHDFEERLKQASRTAQAGRFGASGRAQLGGATGATALGIPKMNGDDDAADFYAKYYLG